ncbi:MAG: putative toxin-antitoxin system toxin component, PIN family [Anaerolineae bacterium]|nr:putative toxin-antitoxin system toxin component, PIN family [Anaerolineae bacterium]
MTIQVVIDTNVVIAGLRSRKGSSFQLLRLIGRSNFEINLSVPLILEYQDALLRQLSELGLTETDVTNLLDYWCNIGNRHKIHYLWRPTLRDPKDEMVLELAVKAQCNFIITFNKRDFIGIEKFGVAALTPGEFLNRPGVYHS